MHQRAFTSSSNIETIIEGEKVTGFVGHHEDSDITVGITHPSEGFTKSLHMPYFARAVHPDGFGGEYGHQRALGLLAELYQEHKGCQCRRRALAHVGHIGNFIEFGRVRYLSIDPGHPNHDCRILAKQEIDEKIWVQIEEDEYQGCARFYDTLTVQPFLMEICVLDGDVSGYIEFVKGDLGFMHMLENTRQKLWLDMVRHARMLQSLGISQRQLEFLKTFSRVWRTGDLWLDPNELDQLIKHGYLVRDSDRGKGERASLTRLIERSTENALRLEASGQSGDATRSRAKARKLQQRIETLTLKITPAGKAIAEQFPQTKLAV